MSEPLREMSTPAAPEAESAPQPPMAWHSFLTKYLLILLPVCHALQAVWILTGGVYYTTAVRDTIYAGIPELRIVDYALCALGLAIAVLELAARKALAKRRTKGVHLLITGQALAVLAWPLYGLARFALTGLSPLSIALIGRSAAQLVLLLVNTFYYARRRCLFSREADGRKESI